MFGCYGGVVEEKVGLSFFMVLSNHQDYALQYLERNISVAKS